MTNIIQEKDGIRVGDRVKCKEYEGYVAVIDSGEYCQPYLLRLKGFDGYTICDYWNRDWFPESEKKQEKNCRWATKEDFTVISSPDKLTSLPAGRTAEELGIKENIIINKPNIIQKTMSIIKQALMSEEDRAIQHFALGENANSLNEDGRTEFTDYIYATGNVDKAVFLKMLVDKMNKDNK